MVYVACMEKRRIYTGFWWEEPMRKMPLGNPRRRWEDNSKKKLFESVWAGFVCLKIWTGGGFL